MFKLISPILGTLTWETLMLSTVTASLTGKAWYLEQVPRSRNSVGDSSCCNASCLATAEGQAKVKRAEGLTTAKNPGRLSACCAEVPSCLRPVWPLDSRP